MQKKDLIQKIQSWLADYEATTPGNVCADDDEATFEGGAYWLLSEALSHLSQK